MEMSELDEGKGFYFKSDNKQQNRHKQAVFPT